MQSRRFRIALVAASLVTVMPVGAAPYSGTPAVAGTGSHVDGFAADSAPAPGYWMLDAGGHVYPFGAATGHGDASGDGKDQHFVDLEPTPTGGGYWTLDATGSVGTFGNATFYGDGGEPASGEAYVSLSATPAGDGYWLFTDRGRVVARGGAHFFGDLSGSALNGGVLSSVATPSGLGYYMVASDGGVFCFGDAAFRGSTGDIRLNRPVVSLAPDPDGDGYWLVASDGGIFSFGAGYYGSAGDIALNQPVVGMVGSGTGYVLVAADGGAFTYGSAPFAGSLGGQPPTRPVVAVALVPPGPGRAAPGVPGGEPTPAGSYSFLSGGQGVSAPPRWDPCTTHPYVVSTTNAGPTLVDDVQEAFRQLSKASGVRFTFAGTVPDLPGPRWGFDPDPRWPGQWAPILVASVHPYQTNLDWTRVAGYGGPKWMWTSANPDLLVSVSGSAMLNADLALAPGFGNSASTGGVLLHELGHIFGLGHVSDRAQIMYPSARYDAPALYGTGDRAGMRALASGGCLPATPGPR